MICRRWPAIGCARMAAPASRRVPFLLSHPLIAAYRGDGASPARLRNFDIFDFALNGVAP